MNIFYKKSNRSEKRKWKFNLIMALDELMANLAKFCKTHEYYLLVVIVLFFVQGHSTYEVVKMDSCYDSFRLPEYEKAVHYELVMAPDLSSSQFQGTVEISIELIMS